MALFSNDRTAMLCTLSFLPPMRRRALLSVSDKTGIIAFAQGLIGAGFEILSTGGTKRALEDADVAVTAVEDVTRFPECFSGRVKTLHPMIAGGILFERGNSEHEKQATKLGIEPIDLVCVNLYPFQQAAKDGAQGKELIEQIDIGGPTLLRAAAKNHAHVTVICDPADYDRVLKTLKENSIPPQALREELAAKVFLRTAMYDAVITTELSGRRNNGFLLKNGITLRYGENPHQWGMFYETATRSPGWSVVQQDESKPMSYLNILDADGAWNLVCDFTEPTAACIKHANPSGVASFNDIVEAFQRSYDTDRLSAFGVIIALNRTCPADVIQKIIDQKIFVELLIAPGFEPRALELLKKRPKLRVIEHHCLKNDGERIAYRTALGGMLVQNEDPRVVTESDLKVVTKKKPSTNQIADLLFAWRVVKHAKSNAIVFARDQVTVGIGTGQTSRVDATLIAARRAGGRAHDAVMASDAFFPFADSVEEAVKHGIAAIVQPGGSVRDDEVIAKANELGIAMVLTGVRGFRH